MSSTTSREEAGIEIPATHFPESAGDIERVAATVRYPCLFKPYESAVGRAAIGLKALHVNSRDELVARFDRFATAETRFMVQEFVPGDDDALVGHLAFWDGEGREHSWLTKQKLRQYPHRSATGAFQVSAIAPEVADPSRTLLRKLAYRGLVAVEFKHDCRDDTYRLMEINPEP